jgi:hypothetical protein
MAGNEVAQSRHFQGGLAASLKAVRLFDPEFGLPTARTPRSAGRDRARWWLSVNVWAVRGSTGDGQIGRSEQAFLRLILKIIRAQYRSVRVIGRVREFRGDGFRADAGARPASLGARDLTVVIDGLPTTDYPHSCCRNSASSITIRACGFTKPDAGSVVGLVRATHPTHPPPAFFPRIKGSPRIKS